MLVFKRKEEEEFWLYFFAFGVFLVKEYRNLVRYITLEK